MEHEPLGQAIELAAKGNMGTQTGIPETGDPSAITSSIFGSGSQLLFALVGYIFISRHNLTSTSKWQVCPVLCRVHKPDMLAPTTNKHTKFGLTGNLPLFNPSGDGFKGKPSGIQVVFRGSKHKLLLLGCTKMDCQAFNFQPVLD